jgi:hypothetical protein
VTKSPEKVPVTFTKLAVWAGVGVPLPWMVAVAPLLILRLLQLNVPHWVSGDVAGLQLTVRFEPSVTRLPLPTKLTAV